MFLHHILNCDDSRLISQVFWAQVNSPVKNDWVLQIKEDLKELGLEYLSFTNIKNMKKEQFRSLLKTKAKRASFKYLMEEKETKHGEKQAYIELDGQTYSLKPFYKLLGYCLFYNNNITI